MISVHKNAIRPINAQVSSIFTRHQKWVFAYKKKTYPVNPHTDPKATIFWHKCDPKIGLYCDQNFQ